MRRSLRLASAALALPFFAATARATHEIPRAMSIEFQPGHPERVIVAAREFGLFSSVDGGATWRLACYEALRGSIRGSYSSVPLVLSASGTVYADASWSTMQSADGLCTFTESFVGGAFPEPLGLGVKRARDGALVGVSSPCREKGTAGSTEAECVTELWYASAPAESLLPSGVPLIEQFVASSFVLAPPVSRSAGAPSVLAGGVMLGEEGAPSSFAMARTDDLGRTWTIEPWIQRAIYEGDTYRELLAVDAENPDLLFARESLGHSSNEEAIWFSSDSGKTWRLLLKGESTLTGFAYSPDGSKVAIGDGIAGLFLVDVASLTAGGSPSIERVFDYPTFAITWNESGLYAGLDEYGARDQPQFATVGISHDEGRTFAPFLSLCDIQPLSCAGSSEAAACFDTFKDIFQVRSERCPDVGGAPANSGGSASGSGGASASSGGVSAMDGGTAPDGAGANGGSGGANGSDEAYREVHASSCATASLPARAPAPLWSVVLGAAVAAASLRRRSRAVLSSP